MSLSRNRKWIGKILPSEEEPMVAEEKTISAVSAASSTFSSASSTLYANESVIEKGNLHLQFKGVLF